MRYLTSDLDAWMANLMAISGYRYHLCSGGTSLANSATPVRVQTRLSQTSLGSNFAQFAFLRPEIRQRIPLDLVESVTIEAVVRTPPTAYGVSIHLKGSRAERGSEFTPVRSFTSIPLYAINSESRDLAIRVFGRPARDAFPFDPHTDTLRRRSNSSCLYPLSAVSGASREQLYSR